MTDPNFDDLQGGHSQAEEAPEAETPAENSAEQKTYTVMKGDSLSLIAKNELNDMQRWKELYELNKNVIGEDPNKIEPGQVLNLPA